MGKIFHLSQQSISKKIEKSPILKKQLSSKTNISTINELLSGRKQDEIANIYKITQGRVSQIWGDFKNEVENMFNSGFSRDELVEVTENLNAIRNYLKSNVQQMNETKESKRGRINEGRPDEAGSIRNIANWLNKNAEVMSIGKISEYLKVENYNEDQVFRGMVIENLTQRGRDFDETSENIQAVEDHLKDNKEILERCRGDSPRHMEKLKNEYKDEITANDIAEWIDNDSLCN